MKKTLIVFLSSFFLFSLAAQKLPSPYDPEISKAFAFDLYQTGFFDEAEIEFRRYLFSTKTPDETAILTLSSIYNTHNDLSGINWLWNNFSKNITLGTEEKVSIVQGRLIFKTGDRDNFSKFQLSIENSLPNYSPTLQTLFPLSGFILNEDFEQAKLIAKRAAEENQIFSIISASLSGYKEKNPGLALFLSILCPGGGKFYTGVPLQGLSSLTTVGLFGAATVYTGIESQWKSWKPYVYGSCGLVLWIVDIYGSYQSAQRYNAALYRSLCQDTENIYEKIY